jgi:hypothetical protein
VTLTEAILAIKRLRDEAEQSKRAADGDDGTGSAIHYGVHAARQIAFEDALALLRDVKD